MQNIILNVIMLLLLRLTKAKKERKIKIMNIVKYWIMKRKMKRDEVMVKAMLYGTIASIMNEQKDIIEFVQNMYMALKDVPMEDLRKELISNIAELAHEQAVKEREAEKSA